MSCPKAMSATPAYVIQFHVVRALHDVHVLVLWRPVWRGHRSLATPFAAHGDLQGLRQEALGHVVCVVTLASSAHRGHQIVPDPRRTPSPLCPGFGFRST
jgi:hypothetical protein